MIDETTKYVERRGLDKADQLRERDMPKPPRKEGKSTFDEMLEQGRLNQQSTLNSKSQTKTTTQQALQESEKLKERQKDQSKDREKEEDRRHESRDEKTQTVHVGKKVVGKEGLKQNQGESGGRSFEGGGSKKENRFALNSKKLKSEEMKLQTGSTAFGKEFQTEFAKSNLKLSKTLPQEILNQIVRYVRIGLNREGHKEIELDLHNKIFQGLRLRLSSNRGKVSLHFLTADDSVRALFEKESSNIQRTLGNKGIAVEEIKVT